MAYLRYLESGLICECCGIEADTRVLRFSYVVGMLILAKTVTVEESLCRNCMARRRAEYRSKTLTLGLWSVPSIFWVPITLISNSSEYRNNLDVAPVPRGALRPELEDDDMRKLSPHDELMIKRLTAGVDEDKIAKMIAKKVKLTPGQVILYMDDLLRSGNYPSAVKAVEARQAAQQRQAEEENDDIL